MTDVHVHKSNQVQGLALPADAELRGRLEQWTRQPLPSEALKRRAMCDSVRVVNQLKANAPLEQLLTALCNLKPAIQKEGIDRRFQRPASREPSVRDLELVASDLVVGPEGLANETLSSGEGSTLN